MQALAELLLAAGSGVPELIAPVAQTWPTDAFQGTAITICELEPRLRTAIEQATFWPPTVHVAPFAVIAPGAGFEKRLEDPRKERLLLSLGPRFDTRNVNVAVPLPGLPVVATDAVSRRS